MTTLARLCPVAWYIGCRFAQAREELHQSVAAITEQIPCSQQTLIRFERGQSSLDPILILKLEKLLRLSYPTYKPPVSYFGFLGFTADSQAMLLKTKQAIKQIKRETRHPDTRRNIERALLAIRFAPLRGTAESSG